MSGIESLVDHLYRLMHMVVWVHYPQDHRWMLPVFVAVLVIAPAWMAWHAARLVVFGLTSWRHARPHSGARPAGPKPQRATVLEWYVLRATWPAHLRILGLSLLIIPATYVLLLLPKHIVDNVLAEGGPATALSGLVRGQEQLLFTLCGIYLVVLTANGLIKYAVNTMRGRISERIVRRIRLAVIRRRRRESSAQGRSTLAAIAIQECEPIGYFGSGLLVEPLIQGGTLLTSLVFLFMQDVALAFAALMMLPVQIAFLPRLQRRINGKVRERVHATRGFNTALAHGSITPSEVSSVQGFARQAETLETVRVEIAELKARFKSLYNYTSNLTPFFFFSIGGYLVLQQRMSLGALVAALAAYREITPALRELFDFAQSWSDARARYAEVTAALGAPTPGPENESIAGPLPLMGAVAG